MELSLRDRLSGARALVLATLLAAPVSAQDTASPTPASATPAAAAVQDAPNSSPAAVAQYGDAVALQNRGLYDLAADEWQKFLDKFGDDPLASKAQHYLGVCRLQLKQYEQAIVVCAAAIQKRPDKELLPATYLNLGLAQYAAAQEGKRDLYVQAASTLATLAQKFPKSDSLGQAIFYRGESLYALGQKADASELYARYLKDNPQGTLLADALYALGVAQEELGSAASAGAQYDALLKQFPTHPLRAEVIMRRGETLFTLGKFGSAAKWFHSAAGHPNFALADYALLREAASLYQLKDYALAATAYARLPEKHPKSSHVSAARLAAGKCYYLAGDLARAEQWLNQAAATGGEQAVEAVHWLARVLIKQDRSADALRLTEQAAAQLGKSPFAANVLMDRADAAHKLEPRGKKVAAYYAAVAQQYPASPIAPQALYMAAFSSLAAADYDGAVGYSKQFLNSYASHAVAADVLFIAAEADIQLGRYAQAAKLYADLLAKYSDHRDRPQWQLRRGLALSLDKKHGDVITAIQPALSSLKDKANVAEANYLIGTAQLELGQHAAAAKSLAASLEADPAQRQADEALLAMAAAQRHLGDVVQATAALRQLITQHPKSKLLDRAHYRLGEYAYAAADYGRAAAEYELLLNKWPDSTLVPHALHGLGWARLGEKQYAPAEKSFSQLLSAHRDHALVPRAHIGRATARQQLGQFAAALEDLSTKSAGSASGKQRVEAHYLTGLCFVGLKQPDKAAETFRAAIAAGPDALDLEKLQYELAWALKAQNKEREATEAFTKLASMKSQSPLALEAQYHVADASYNQGQYAAAAVGYRKVLEKAAAGELAEKASHKLAWAQFQQKDFSAAQKSFAAQLDRWPGGALAADARFMIAESLFKMTHFQEAWAAYEGVLRAPPASENARVLALLHAAQSASQLKRWPDASHLLARALRDHPKTQYRPEIVYEQAWAIQNQSQADEALRLYDQVASQAQHEIGARARFMMGEILFERKQHKEAIRNYFKVAYGYGYPQSPEPIRKWQASSAYEAARCFEVLKMLDQAKKSYQEVLEKYPTSDKAPLAKTRIEALGA